MKGKLVWIRYPKKGVGDEFDVEVSIKEKDDRNDNWDAEYEDWKPCALFELEQED